MLGRSHQAAFYRVIVDLLQRPNKNLAARRGREDWQPFDDGCSDEMRGVEFVDPIAAAHRSWSKATEMGDKLVSVLCRTGFKAHRRTPPPREMEFRPQVRSQIEFIEY